MFFRLAQRSRLTGEWCCDDVQRAVVPDSLSQDARWTALMTKMAPYVPACQHALPGFVYILLYDLVDHLSGHTLLSGHPKPSSTRSHQVLYNFVFDAICFVVFLQIQDAMERFGSNSL